jgi:hypothetical protein
LSVLGYIPSGLFIGSVLALGFALDERVKLKVEKKSMDKVKLYREDQTMKRIVIFCVLLLSLGMKSDIVSAPLQWDIRDYGARGDGKTVNTIFIQKAVNACYAAGGGTVVVPSGMFITGTIFLKSNIHLHLEPGACLKGSDNVADFSPEGLHRGLLFAREARSVTITGPGIIDGNGTKFHIPDHPHVGQDFDRKFIRQGNAYMTFESGIQDGPIAYKARPGMLIVLLQCEQVLLADITLRDSPEWTIRIGDCDGVSIHNVSIYNNLLVPNSDGIHITTSRNVRVSDCDIRAGDDAIIVTGFGTDVGVHGDSTYQIDYSSRPMGNKTGYAENVTVTNCVLQSRSSGIRIGYGKQPIRNCVFENLVIYESNRGIGVFSRDEGSIENILFSNIRIQTRIHTGHWWGNGEPIHVSAISQTNNQAAGNIRNIHFQHILAESETGILIYSEDKGQIRDLVLKDVRLQIKPGMHVLTYGGNFDLRPVADLEYAIFKHDIPGLYARNVAGFRLSDFCLIWENDLPNFFTHGIQIEKFTDVYINGFYGRQASVASDDAAIYLENGAGISIVNAKADIGTNIFLKHGDVKDKRLFRDNDTFNAKKVFDPSPSTFMMDED